MFTEKEVFFATFIFFLKLTTSKLYLDSFLQCPNVSQSRAIILNSTKQQIIMLKKYTILALSL